MSNNKPPQKPSNNPNSTPRKDTLSISITPSNRSSFEHTFIKKDEKPAPNKPTK